jgi:clan AA aspartic protease (TIGR02281 family)
MLGALRGWGCLCVRALRSWIWGVATSLALASSVSPAAAASIGDPTAQAQQVIPIESRDGAYMVPVLINGILTENFIIDSGSADVSIPVDVASTLQRLGAISPSDLIGNKTYILADGSRVLSAIYRIASLKIGDLVMQNVTVRIAPEKSHFLLGQSFLSRLKSWSMDNARRALIIN